jgi:hypothetical protein
MSRLAPRGALVVVGGLLLAAVVALLAATPASAKRGLTTGFQENDLITGDDALRNDLLDDAAREEAGIIRLNVHWRDVARKVPANAADPADPAYNFAQIDAAVRAIAERGMEPLLMVDKAPAFAEGRDRPSSAPAGSWRPDPSAFAAFARAVATRYSGAFAGLPRVRFYQAWNEPNLSLYLTPQREGESLAAVDQYRAMLDAFYAGVKAVDSGNVVITGGTAPYGDPSGPNRIRPVAFLRALLCVSADLQTKTCEAAVPFDVLSHHPINTAGGPLTSAIDPDDASTPDLGRVSKVLRAAERLGTAPGGRHPIWATEVWWESDPPDGIRGVPLRRHARWLEQALYVLWKQGAEVVLNFEIHDEVYDPANPLASLQSGVFFRNGKPKPAATAFRFPFVGDRVGKGKLLVWGRAPRAGRVRISRRHDGGWQRVASLKVRDGAVFTRRLSLGGREKLRARIGRDKSLPWFQR